MKLARATADEQKRAQAGQSKSNADPRLILMRLHARLHQAKAAAIDIHLLMLPCAQSRALNPQHVQLAGDIAEGQIGPGHESVERLDP